MATLQAAKDVFDEMGVPGSETERIVNKLALDPNNIELANEHVVIFKTWLRNAITDRFPHTCFMMGELRKRRN